MVDELGRRMRGWPRLTRQPDLSTARFLRQVTDELRECGFRDATLEVGDADGLVARARRADALVVEGDRAALPLTCGDLGVDGLVVEHPGLADDAALVEALRDAAGLLDLAVQTLDGAAARRAHEASHDQLFANMRNGLAHCRAIFDGERCVDWVYLRVNEAFVRQTGLAEVTGRRVTEAIPGIREADPELFALYGAVTRGGETVRFERHVAALDEWFEVAAYRAGPDEFVAVFDVVTDRKRAEARLHASERRFRAMFEEAAVGIALMGPAGQFRRVNPRLCELLGYTEAELRQRSYMDITHADHADSDAAAHARFAAGELTTLVLEKQLVRKDGGHGWHRVTISRCDAEADEQTYVAVTEDINAERVARETQHQLAAALAASEARHRAIFEQAGVGIGLADQRTGRFVEVNDALCRTLGYARDELLRLTWRDVTPAEDVARMPADFFDPAVQTLTMSKHYLRRDGSRIAGRVTVTRLTAPDGTPLNLAFVEDVTEQRRAEDALRESQRRLTLVFEQSLAGMAIVRLRDHVVTEVSDSLVRMFGWSRDEWLGHSGGELGLFVDPTDRDRARALQVGTAAPIELPARRKSGEVGTFLLTVGRIAIDGEPCALTLWHDITEVRRADAARLESERHLAALIDLAPIGIAEIDLDTGRPRWVNARLCEITGYTAAELSAMSMIDELTVPADRASSRALGAEVLAGRHARLHVEKRYRHKDGRTVWVELSVAALYDAGGRVTGTLTTIQDITAHRADREALELQAQALNAAANAIVITDPRGVIERVNPAFVELTGYAAAELLGADMRLFSSGLQAPEFYRALWQTVTAGRVWRGELINRRKDGSRYHEEMTITPVCDATGAITRFVAIKQDVSARHHAERALRLSETRYRALVDDLDDVVFATDLDGRLTFVNRAVAALGYTPTALLGRALEELVPLDDQAAWQELLAPGGEPPPRELRLYDAHGKLRTVRVRVRRRPPGDPEPGVTGVLIDLTARRETEDQLRAAQKMEAVGRLAGGVAHDFNNLLSVILSYTDLAVGDLHAEDPLRGDLEEVLAAARRAEGLTRQLLAFSRKQVLSPEPTALAELVGGLAKMLQRLIGEDVELVLRDLGTTEQVTVDRGQLEQVLMNLVVNARDAMPRGGRVTITTAELDLDTATAHGLDLPPGRYLELAVADTGCGIDAAIQERIFEPFFTTKGVGKGTGLGLSMVYGIVRQSGGAITVTSQPGQGATFRVFLPARDPHAPTRAARTTAHRLDRGDETVLVVEDEAALRSVVQRVLAAAGYEVLVAANATEAQLLAERHGARVRLILTDVVMPAMSGPELVERLRPCCPAAEVIFMSGYTDDALARFGLLAADFLRKPFDLRVLTARVRAALDRPAG